MKNQAPELIPTIDLRQRRSGRARPMYYMVCEETSGVFGRRASRMIAFAVRDPTEARELSKQLDHQSYLERFTTSRMRVLHVARRIRPGGIPHIPRDAHPRLAETEEIELHDAMSHPRWYGQETADDPAPKMDRPSA